MLKNKFVVTWLIISFLIPVFIVGYEVIWKGGDSVRFTFDSTTGYLFALYYIMLFAFCTFLFIDWMIRKMSTLRTLKNEKTKAELSQLKAQVNPHFFFNMLNNLYGWIDKDSETAKELILKLSDLMRFSIYEGEKDTVLLTDEVTFLDNFIDLNRMRYHKKIDITFHKDIQDSTLQIMPLMFIILVENAFKHGVEKRRDNAFVRIQLVTSTNELAFKIENNYDTSAVSTPGIGLQNLKSRLNIMYPGKHEFSTSTEKDVFTAELKIRF